MAPKLQNQKEDTGVSVSNNNIISIHEKKKKCIVNVNYSFIFSIPNGYLIFIIEYNKYCNLLYFIINLSIKVASLFK